MGEAIDNRTVESVLGRAVSIVNPTLDVLTRFDPLGLKARTKEPQRDLLDVPAWFLNLAGLPGTAKWDTMDADARSRWWVIRVGALNNLIVAYPGVFGWIADRFPIQSTLAYSNQVIVLCAIARENGLDDDHDYVRMLAQVLNKRVINEPMPVPVPTEEQQWTPFALAKALFKVSKMAMGAGDELDRRPLPTKPFRYLSALPYVGFVADYVGEFGALRRAADDGERWVRTNLPQR